jgi:TPR repeat protein
MYYNGFGVSKDYAEALAWFRKAADQGHVFARYMLGAMYASGLGAPKDYAGAVAWYRKAADQGYSQAQVSLGNMYQSEFPARLHEITLG